MNILLTNVGRRTYFVDYLNYIKKNKFNLKIFISDRTKKVASFFTDHDYFLVTPSVINNYKKYIEKLYSLSVKYKINMIIPLSDLDLVPLSMNKKLFKKINIDILVSDLNIVNICESKIDLNKFLKLNKLPFSKNYLKIDDIKSKKIIEKPIKGSGSQDINIINPKKLNFLKKDYLYQDFINGTEYGLDILNDWKGNFISYCLKRKIEMRGGETDKAMTLNDSRILKLAKKISLKLKHIGNLDCDLIMDNKGNIHIIDFNCRFGGGYPFTHSVGLNYLLFMISQKLPGDLPVLPLKYDEKFISKGISIFYEN